MSRWCSKAVNRSCFVSVRSWGRTLTLLPLLRHSAHASLFSEAPESTPAIVSAAEFNHRNQSDGMGLITLEKPTLGERLLRREWTRVRIPRRFESNHFMLVGDIGSGKS